MRKEEQRRVETKAIRSMGLLKDSDDHEDSRSRFRTICEAKGASTTKNLRPTSFGSCIRPGETPTTLDAPRAGMPGTICGVNSITNLVHVRAPHDASSATTIQQSSGLFKTSIFKGRLALCLQISTLYIYLAHAPSQATCREIRNDLADLRESE